MDQIQGMRIFVRVVEAGTFTRAADSLGLPKGTVTKQIQALESRLHVKLLNRTTRRISLTQEGETYLQHARRILGEIDGMEELLGVAKATPKGLLRVNATLGFGCRHVAPLISKFVRKYPQVEVQLQLSVNPPALTDDSFDVCIRFGAPPDSRVIARHIAPNRRLLCASPAYLAKHGIPKVPNDLTKHNCIGIRQGEEAYGVWRLASGRGRSARTEAIKTRGNLATNDGEIAVNWALDGHGLLLRAEWDIERYLRNGRLVQVLPQYETPDADIHAVYPQRHQLAARVRAFVDFVALALKQEAAAG